ncbi:MAG: PDZ domain-containing protein [Acidobacteria bacterium]|nr:PDZ domain-containing protein [Acidobacteriota bacterium]MCY3970681.1 PDZ domain-containing protein [Acidobacteriota bacterium]
MSRIKVWLAFGLALAVVAPAVAADGEEKKVRKIQVKKLIECADGEDCDERVSRMLFVSDDGDVRVLHEGDHEWVTEENVKILETDGHGVIMIGDHGGEGEAGESVRRRVHQVLKGLGEHGSRLHLRHGGGGFLGVQLSDLTPELRTHFGVPEDVGVMVGKVVDGSPALRAGLEVGDVVTAVDGEPVASSSALARAVGGREDGETVVLEVWRDGKMEKISATLEERERRVEMSSAAPETPRPPRPPVPGAGEHAVGENETRVIEVKVDCGDGEDCTVDVANANSFEFAASACGDSGECEINVDCTDGDCACTVNGESADCSELGF